MSKAFVESLTGYFPPPRIGSLGLNGSFGLNARIVRLSPFGLSWPVGI